MSKIGVFFAQGCEEMEGLIVVDVLRRAKFDVVSISVTDEKMVTGSHDITFCTDMLFQEVDFNQFDALVLPGGMPGTQHLQEHEGVKQIVQQFFEAKKLVAAICAAPSVLGSIGILKGKQATCHPGFEDKLQGAYLKEDNVVVDQNVITSRGMGTAIDFGLAIVSYFGTQELLEDVKKHLVYV